MFITSQWHKLFFIWFYQQYQINKFEYPELEGRHNNNKINVNLLVL